MASEYISVMEFARLAGISKQRAYQIVKQDKYKVYITIDNGKTLINKDALKARQDKSKDKSKDNVCQDIDPQRMLINQLQDQVKDLQSERDKLLKLLDQQQQLTAHLQSRLELIEHPAPEEPIEMTPEEHPAPAEKKSWWSRLFG